MNQISTLFCEWFQFYFAFDRLYISLIGFYTSALLLKFTCPHKILKPQNRSESFIYTDYNTEILVIYRPCQIDLWVSRPNFLHSTISAALNFRNWCLSLKEQSLLTCQNEASKFIDKGNFFGNVTIIQVLWIIFNSLSIVGLNLFMTCISFRWNFLTLTDIF